MQCAAFTKKGRPCPIDADRLEQDGRWVCHIHHSAGLFQSQVKANRADRRHGERAQCPRCGMHVARSRLDRHLAGPCDTDVLRAWMQRHAPGVVMTAEGR